MKQPEGFVKKGQEHLVCKLKKSLYGLKQAPRCWNETFDDFCTKFLGFSKCQKDTATYVRGSGHKQLYIGVYVDDLIILGEDLEEINKIKQKLNSRFNMQDFGEVKMILGMKVEYDRKVGKLSLSQQKYIEEILKRYRMEDATQVVNPLQTGVKLSVRDCPMTTEEQREMSGVPYRSVVGSLQYLVGCTRPDLATTIGILSRFLNNPGKAHWEAAKRVLKYVKGTADLKLTYKRKEEEPKLRGYVDSDFAGCIDTSRSTSGWIFFLGGTAICWQSKRQTAVTLSTCEAEYMAMGLATKEALFLKEFMEELFCFEKIESVKLYCDSQSAIKLLKNPVLH
jgi:hypothetical protein